MRLQRKGLENHGFTLIEIIIMLIILSILAAVIIPKVLGLRNDACDASARNLLSALRTANELEYGKRVIDGRSPNYTMGDILGRLPTESIEHINFSNHGMKIHVLIKGESYWYTMSVSSSELPSVTEWKRDWW
jgi:prepilin-type N-terminal cleavage/methylation domain-containing protein